MQVMHNFKFNNMYLYTKDEENLECNVGFG